MAVTHGSVAEVYLNGYDTGAWANQASFNMMKEIHDSTVLTGNSGVRSHTADLKDATANISGFYDYNLSTDSESGDYMLEAAYNNASNDSSLLYFPGDATTVGDRGYAFSGDLTSKNISTPFSGLVTAEIEMQSSTGKSDVKLLATLASRTNSFTGTSLDNTAGTTNGGVGYVHCTAYTSGTVPILIEHSTDNSVWSTLITFTNITAAHSYQRIAVSGTVNRYVRAKAVGTYVGTFIVAFDRN